jgi:hypothetical protein
LEGLFPSLANYTFNTRTKQNNVLMKNKEIAEKEGNNE